MINWWSTTLDSDSQEEMNRAFVGKRLTLGSYAQECENLFCESLDVPYAILTNSGSSALLMSLLALGIKPGDEVIVPALTWIATAQAAAILGCKVVLCDCKEEAPVMDLEHLESLINKNTKAIIPVHLNGRNCDIHSVLSIAKSVGASVVEDACKALFSRIDEGFLGSFGATGCFSLGMISPISIGYGGLVVTRDKDLYEKLNKIRDHGVERSPENYAYLGYNFKISDLLASLAVPQLRKREKTVSRLKEIHQKYSKALDFPNLSILPTDGVPIYVEARSKNREALIAHLEENGIAVSRYHLPTSAASYLGNDQKQFVHANQLTKECFILPSGPAQKDEDIQKVIEAVNQYEESNERYYSFCHK